MADHLLVQADAREIPLPDGCVQCVVTSPPYYGLRDYGVDGQIGLEPTPAEYVAEMVRVFREVRRVLRHDGTVWLNIGDSYANDTKWGGQGGDPASKNYTSGLGGCVGQKAKRHTGFKPKELMMIPARLAIALCDDGWYLRSNIRWCKKSPMPESVVDRPTSAVEDVFLLAKSPRYFYDQNAERVEFADSRMGNPKGGGQYSKVSGRCDKGALSTGVWTKGEEQGGRNLWNYWIVGSQPFPGAHFATMPPEIARRCIRLGTSEKGQCPACGSPWRRVVEREKVTRERPNDYVKRTGSEGTGNSCANTVAGVAFRTKGWEPSCPCPPRTPVPQLVLDPFNGAGTTGLVATGLGRRYVGTDLSRPYLEMARRRIEQPHTPVPRADRGEVLPLFAGIE